MNFKKIFTILISIFIMNNTEANLFKGMPFSQKTIVDDVDQYLEIMRKTLATNIIDKIITSVDIVSTLTEDPVMAKIDKEIESRDRKQRFRKMLAEYAFEDRKMSMGILKAYKKRVIKQIATTTEEQSLSYLNIMLEEINKKIDSFEEIKKFLNILPKDIAQNTVEQKEQVSEMEAEYLTGLSKSFTRALNTSVDPVRKYYFTALKQEIHRRITGDDNTDMATTSPDSTGNPNPKQSNSICKKVFNKIKKAFGS